MAMRMLGNSTCGLSPKNKHILYRACVVSIATYGHRLWFYEGAKNVGALKTLSSMQRKAALWITGRFVRLQPLSERAAYRTATLSDTHPLRSLMPEGMWKGAKPRYSAACWLTPLKREKVRDAISQTAKALPRLTESFQPCVEEAAPGTRLMDLYADQVGFNVFNKRRENTLDVRRTELNTIWNSARVRHDALLIGTDASVPKDKHFQVVAAYCWEGLDDYELEPGRVLAGRVLSTDAELTAIRFALCHAVLRPGCNRIVLFTDSIAMARRAVDLSVHSGQTHSLAVCKALATWFSGHPERSVLFVETPSKLNWGIHYCAHQHATGMAPVRSGGHLATSFDSVRKDAADSALDRCVAAATRKQWITEASRSALAAAAAHQASGTSRFDALARMLSESAIQATSGPSTREETAVQEDPEVTDRRAVEEELKLWDESGIITNSHPESKDFNLLRYWQANQGKYPLLWSLALDTLPKLALAVPCERVFSSSKETDALRRLSMSPLMMEILQIMNSEFELLVLDIDPRIIDTLMAEGKIAELCKLVDEAWAGWGCKRAPAQEVDLEDEDEDDESDSDADLDSD
ncbi:hypothetical protein NMY22_g5628 [Coprinellus aureogranulatus]|nr:hypothetical protein NMY22_g5628 [Coprinellus aureogranulatus]